MSAPMFKIEDGQHKGRINVVVLDPQGKELERFDNVEPRIRWWQRLADWVRGLFGLHVEVFNYDPSVIKAPPGSARSEVMNMASIAMAREVDRDIMEHLPGDRPRRVAEDMEYCGCPTCGCPQDRLVYLVPYDHDGNTHYKATLFKDVAEPLMRKMGAPSYCLVQLVHRSEKIDE